MRILVTSQHFHPETFRINDVVAELHRAGHAVTVLTGQPNYPEGRIYPGYRATSAGEDRSMPYEIFRVPVVPRGSGSALRLLSEYLSFICSAALCGAWLLRGRRYDVVFCYGTSPIFQALPAWILSLLKRSPLVTWVQDLWPESLSVTGYVQGSRKLRAVGVAVSWLYRRHDLLLLQSDGFFDAVRARAGHTPLAFHPNPGESAPKGDLPPDLPMIKGIFRVVFAGNLGKAQALSTILAAAVKLQPCRPDIHISIIGSGQSSSWLKSEVERLGLRNLETLGRFPAVAMPWFFEQSDALLLTLAKDPVVSMTLPSKLQSYLAAARPIIGALDGEGSRVIRENAVGLCGPAEDVQALCANLEALADMSANERAAAGTRARAVYDQTYAPEHLTPRLVAFFQSAIDRRATKSVST